MTRFSYLRLQSSLHLSIPRSYPALIIAKKILPVVVIMGVSGSGKTTLARSLAHHTEWNFLEGDDLHPAVNIAKMSEGIALSDSDRVPWLTEIAAWIRQCIENKRPGIVTCSALKRAYRDLLRHGTPTGSVAFVVLDGPPVILVQRMKERTHFMPVSLLDSQLSHLEHPTDQELSLTLDISASREKQLAAVLDWLGLPS